MNKIKRYTNSLIKQREKAESYQKINLNLATKTFFYGNKKNHTRTGY